MKWAQTKPKKVQIYATPRSGSNYLHDIIMLYMDACPKCADNPMWTGSPFSFNNDELMGLDTPEQIRQAVCNKMEALINGKTNAAVWKTHPGEMEDEIFKDMDDLKKVTMNLAQHNIVLTRRDIWSTVLSATIARHKLEWLPPYNDTSKIHIDPEFFELVCKSVIEGNYMTLANNPHNIKAQDLLFYEDDIVGRTPKEIFGSLSICDTLTEELPEVDEVIVHTGQHYDQLKDNNSKAPDKKDIVSNYDQLYELAIKIHKKYEIDGLSDLMTIDQNCMITDINLESYR